MRYQDKTFKVGGYEKAKQTCDRCKQDKSAYISSKLGFLCTECYTNKRSDSLRELETRCSVETTFSILNDDSFRELGDTGHPVDC